MEATCQRCNEPLRESDRYCSVCGLPQLVYLVEAETPSVPFGPNDGTVVPVSLPGLSTSGIVWQPALRAAVLLAIPAGFLCFEVMPVSVLLALLLMVGAATCAVLLYSKRVQVARISTGIGARIGLITGLIAGWLALSINGLGLWVARFAMHQGGRMDAEMFASINSLLQQQHQMNAQMGVSSADAAQIEQFYHALLFSPTGRAGSVLVIMLLASGLLILFATVGGAVGARFLTQQRRPGA